MALRGQILGLQNEGHYQYLLRVGVLDDALTGLPGPIRLEGEAGDEDESLSPDQAMEIYECRLDYTNPEKPMSFPLGRLTLPLELFDRYQSPGTLSPVQARLWKIGCIVDTIITDIFSTDLLEIVRGDEWPAALSGANEAAPETHPHRPVRCPDCGTEFRVAVPTGSGSHPTHTCAACGRQFEL